MTPTAFEAARAAIAAWIARGLAQDASLLQYVRSMHREPTPEAITELLADRHDPEAASLLQLLLFPGEDARLALEPVLEKACCTPQDAENLAAAVEAEVSSAEAVLPDGLRIALPLEPGDVRLFVARLRPERTAPAKVRAVLDSRHPTELGVGLKSMLRHTRLGWTPQAQAFVCALLDGMQVSAQDTADALDWSLRYLAALEQDASPLDGLGKVYAALEANLKRSRDLERMLRSSSYEVMISQGVRSPCLHEEGIRREMALADIVCLAVVGQPAWALAGLGQTDLGTMDDPEALMEAFTRLGG